MTGSHRQRIINNLLACWVTKLTHFGRQMKIETIIIIINTILCDWTSKKRIPAFDESQSCRIVAVEVWHHLRQFGLHSQNVFDNLSGAQLTELCRAKNLQQEVGICTKHSIQQILTDRSINLYTRIAWMPTFYRDLSDHVTNVCAKLQARQSSNQHRACYGQYVISLYRLFSCNSNQ